MKSFKHTKFSGLCTVAKRIGYILYHTVFCSSELYCIALHYIVLYCTAFCYTALRCVVLHCTALLCTALYCTALHCTALHCTVLHCTALYCTTLHCTALHCTTHQMCYFIQLNDTIKHTHLYSELVIKYFKRPFFIKRRQKQCY